MICSHLQDYNLINNKKIILHYIIWMAALFLMSRIYKNVIIYT